MRNQYSTIQQQFTAIHSQGITGNGVTLAVLDTGIYPHIDFRRTDDTCCISCFRDMVNQKEKPYDDNGHGTHVSGIIASSHPQIGIAPGVRLISLKVLDQRGNGKINHMLSALEWILEHRKNYNIKIVNISVGMPTHGKYGGEEDALVRKVEELWDEEITVIVAAGNEGPKFYSITSPGISKKVITVGVVNEPTELYKKDTPGYYSGRGPVPGSCVCKPDICAPGSHIVSCDNQLGKYAIRSGTSMAAPVVSGLAALMLEKNPKLTNVEIKKKILYTAKDYGLPGRWQGCGLIQPLSCMDFS